MEPSSKSRGQKARERKLQQPRLGRRRGAETARPRSEPSTGPERALASARHPEVDALTFYQHELQRLPLLDARQEQALGREIEQLKLEHWCALLSYRPALGVIAGVRAAHQPRRARRLEALRAGQSPLFQAAGGGTPPTRWAPEVVAAGKQLLALDIDRLALGAADEAVHAAFVDDGRARAYLARVARARATEQRAKGRFVTANLRLVIAMARRYARGGLLPLSDLIQEGNLGLMRAVERFDYRRGYRFSTYATWWIRHYFNRSSADTARLVRVPVHALDALAQAARASRQHEAKTGAELGPGELAQHLGVSEERFAQLRADAVVTQPLSLDRNIGSDREQTFHELLPAVAQVEPEHALDLSAWREALPKLLQTLPPIEAAILRLRFGLDDGEELTLRVVGEKYNLSRERIRQLQEQALDRLRRTLSAANDRDSEGERELSTPDGSDASAAA